MEKDNKEEITTQKDNTVSVALAVFIKDQSAWYLYKKSEKISKAFFLLTRHMPEDHMLKNHMRTKALDLMLKAQALLLDKQATEAGTSVVLEVLSLIALSDTALSAEQQSERNHSIIVRELESFIKDLSTWSEGRATATYVPTSLFDMSDIPFVAPIQAEPRGAATLNPSSIKKATNKAGQQVRSHTRETAVSDMQVGTYSDMRKGTRQDSILQTVRNQGEVSIKDLVAVIKGCSEKTIQRELISLVNAGILSKTGERRWSRYSIASR